VRDAQASKPPIQRLVDKVASVFVPIVIAIALAAFGVWYAFGPEPRLAYAAVIAVSVLVIACPCAVGLATPISSMVRVGKAADVGVLVREGGALQAAGRVDVIALDKTGTITEGRPALTDIVPLAGHDASEVLGVAAAVEIGSEHPFAGAVVEGARSRGVAVQS